MSVSLDWDWRKVGVAVAVVVVLAVAVELFLPAANPLTDVMRIAFDASYLAASLRLTVPIAFAALGGIFAEKSGVINIGLEGLLIIAAFVSILVPEMFGGGDPSTGMLWVGFIAAVVASTLLALVFAVVTIDFKADQVIAGLAIWFLALGFAPFASSVIWGSVNSPSVATLPDGVPFLELVPVVGPFLFDSAPPSVYMLLVAAPLSWYVLNYTAFGRWVRASGENPKALDTAGVDVRRVRYASVLISGVLSGIGGAGLALGQVGQFIGSGATMVDGRGWIGITAYLFGNYNPLGAFGASFLFASLTALQYRLQQLPAYEVPSSLIQMIPYVTVIVVLALVGRTQTPEEAGEHYESGEE